MRPKGRRVQSFKAQRRTLGSGKGLTESTKPRDEKKQGFEEGRPGLVQGTVVTTCHSACEPEKDGTHRPPRANCLGGKTGRTQEKQDGGSQGTAPGKNAPEGLTRGRGRHIPGGKVHNLTPGESTSS